MLAGAPLAPGAGAVAASIVRQSAAFNMRAASGRISSPIAASARLRPPEADPVVQNQLGVQKRQAGQFADAKAAYERALVLDPNYAEGHNNLGLIYLAQGKLTEAAAEFKKEIGTLEARLEAALEQGGPPRQFDVQLLADGSDIDATPEVPWSLKLVLTQSVPPAVSCCRYANAPTVDL